MANIVVYLKGTKEIYRYETTKGGKSYKKFLRTENISDRKVFVTTPNGDCLIDGVIYNWSVGNDVYKELVRRAGHKEYDSHCGRYTFLNIDDCEITIKKIDTKEFALELSNYFDNSIDQYVDYIDNGAQHESGKRHNAMMDNMANALKSIAETL